MAMLHSQDMAFTKMKSTIYLIIQDSSRFNHLKKNPHNLGPLSNWRDHARVWADENGLIRNSMII